MPKLPIRTSRQSTRRSSSPSWLRWLLVFLVFITIIIGTIFWIIQGSQAIIPIAVLTALGIIFGFIQNLPIIFPEMERPDEEGLDPPVPQPPDTPKTTKRRATTRILAGSNSFVDKGDIQLVSHLYGRDKDIDQLRHWIIDEKCSVVAILGSGGIGKTSLANALMNTLLPDFTCVLWRSVRNAQPLTQILDDCIQLFSQLEDLPDTIDDPFALVVDYLNRYRCLVVLDNFESILDTGSQVGYLRANYEDYGRFIGAIAATQQSCLILTSREKPHQITLSEGLQSPIRSMNLSGLGTEAGQELLKGSNLQGDGETWRSLIRLYAGNPLYLKVASEPIRTLFGGNIQQFLNTGRSVFSNLRQPLDIQFSRLSAEEQDIMYWLAIEREAVSLEMLTANSLGSLSAAILLDSFTSLQRRSIIESVEGQRFTLQPAIMEYVLDKVIQKVITEIQNGTIDFLGSHFLLKAQSKEYIRNSQINLILLPILEQLKGQVGQKECERLFQVLLSSLHTLNDDKPGYAAGNLINLLIHLPCEKLSAYDFSSLEIRQAYLQGAMLPYVNFKNARFFNTVFTETFGTVPALAFNPTGKFLAAGSDSGELRIWRYPGNTPHKTFLAHTDWVRTIAFSHDGHLLATGSHDQHTKIWNVQTGECLQVLHGHDKWVRTVAFSPNGSLLITCSEDQKIRIWNVKTGQCLYILHGHSERIFSITCTPDGSLLASGGPDGTIKIWNLQTGEVVKTIAVSDKGIGCLAFLSNNELVSASGDYLVRLWDIQTEECLRVFKGHTDWLWSLAISSDSSLIASGGEDTTVRLWNARTGDCLKILRGHQQIIHTLAFHPTDDLLVSGSEDQTIRFWDLKTGHCVNVLQGYTNPAWTAAFSPDGKFLASGYNDQIVRLWDLSQKKVIKNFCGHSQIVYSVAYKPDGKMLASASQDHTVRLWDIESGDCVRTLIGHTERVYSVAFSPDGHRLISAGHDQIMRLWNVRTGDCIRRFHKSTSPICCAAYSPTDPLIASGNYDHTIQLWNSENGQCLQTLTGHTSAVWSVAFSGSGTILASASHDQTVRIWDVRSGTCLHCFKGHDEWVSGVAIRASGDLVASVGGDQRVHIWSISRKASLNVLPGHTSGIWKVTFSPDGRTIASSSQDGTIRLWNVRTGAPIAVLQNERPYEGMIITDVRGLTDAQKSALRNLGAIEERG